MSSELMDWSARGALSVLAWGALIVLVGAPAEAVSGVAGRLPDVEDSLVSGFRSLGACAISVVAVSAVTDLAWRADGPLYVVGLHGGAFLATVALVCGTFAITRATPPSTPARARAALACAVAVVALVASTVAILVRETARPAWSLAMLGLLAAVAAAVSLLSLTAASAGIVASRRSRDLATAAHGCGVMAAAPPIALIVLAAIGEVPPSGPLAALLQALVLFGIELTLVAAGLIAAAVEVEAAGGRRPRLRASWLMLGAAAAVVVCGNELLGGGDLVAGLVGVSPGALGGGDLLVRWIGFSAGALAILAAGVGLGLSSHRGRGKR